MTPDEELAVEAITSLPSFATNPAGEVAQATASATQAETGIGVYGGTASERKARAAFWTHVACALVALASNPNVTRGTILEGLVERYGSGIPVGS